MRTSATAHTEESWAHRPVISVRADSDEGRLPVIALVCKTLRHSPSPFAACRRHTDREGLVGAQLSEQRQGGQRRGEAAGDHIGTQRPAAQPQPVRSPPRRTGTHSQGTRAVTSTHAVLEVLNNTNRPFALDAQARRKRVRTNSTGSND